MSIADTETQSATPFQNALQRLLATRARPAYSQEDAERMDRILSELSDSDIAVLTTVTAFLQEHGHLLRSILEANGHKHAAQEMLPVLTIIEERTALTERFLRIAAGS